MVPISEWVNHGQVPDPAPCVPWPDEELKEFRRGKFLHQPEIRPKTRFTPKSGTRIRLGAEETGEDPREGGTLLANSLRGGNAGVRRASSGPRCLVII